MVEEEEHHDAALKALASSANGFTSTHAIAETFATLTSGRLEIQLTPDEATEVIDANIIGRLQVVDLPLADYRQAMRNSHAVGRAAARFLICCIYRPLDGRVRHAFSPLTSAIFRHSRPI